MPQRIAALLLFVCTGSLLWADSATIGSVAAQGDFKLDNYTVRESGTVLEGSTIETADSVADVRLSDGTTIQLQTNSAGAIYHDRLVLLRGSADWSPSSAFHAEASGLVIAPTIFHSTAVITVEPGETINVAATTGAMQLREGTGKVLAQLGPMQRLTLSRDQAGKWQVAGKSSQQPADDIRFGKGNGDDNGKDRDHGGYKGDRGDHCHPHPSR